MTMSDEEEYFVALEMAPERMDRLWADGWRHFGWLFFRYRFAMHGEKRYSVLPLRIDLARFELSRSQRRVLAKNADLEVVVRESFVDAEKERLFERHAERFEENAPRSLYDFVSPVPASVPCRNREVAVLHAGRLVAFTFLDVGRDATSAVYAAFDPDESARSLGIFMMLASIGYSRERGCRYYYHGYAYRESFVYDYKKRFSALEYLSWGDGLRPYSEPDPPRSSEPPPEQTSCDGG